MQFAAELIRIPSLPGQEEAVARRIVDELEVLGFDDAWTDRAGNVIGRIVGRGGAPGLLLSSHMDVVDVGDPEAWEHPPYGGVVADGCLHGRGAMDVKGPLALQLYAAARFVDERPEGDLLCVFSVHEEKGGWGMMHFMDTSGIRPGAVILSEATGLDLCTGHRGHAELAVEIHGLAAHASTPERGRNPNHLLPHVLLGIRDLSRVQPSHPVLGDATLTPTVVECWPRSGNVVPDRVRVTLDWRVLPGWDEAAALDQLRAAIAARVPPEDGIRVEVLPGRARFQAWTGYEEENSNFTPGFLLDDDHPLVVAAAETLREVLGRAPEIRRWMFGTDGGHSCGTHGVPTIGFAPGREALAHTNRERLDLEEARQAFDAYPALIRRVQAGLVAAWAIPVRGIHPVAAGYVPSSRTPRDRRRIQVPPSTPRPAPEHAPPKLRIPGIRPGSGLFTGRAGRIGTEEAFNLGARVAEVESLGERVIRCSLGQPDYPLPGHIADALKRAVDRGLTTYCAPEGIPELRRAVAHSLGERQGLDIDPDRVVVYPGHRPAIGFAHLAYVEAGEEVVYPSPGYPLYESFIPYFRSVPVPAVLREEDGFGLARDVFEPLLGERTALIFLNFPSNPTGSVATREQLETLAGLILERTGPHVRVFSDESYEFINFDGHEHVSIASIPGMESRTILSSGCSKTFAWTGGRVGWAVYPTVAEARMARRLSINHFASISPYNQWAAVEALTSPLSAPAIQAMVKGYQRRRDLVVSGLGAIPAFRCHTPRGAFYAFPNVSGALERLGALEAHARLPEEVRANTSPATLFQLFLLHEYRVATVDRRSFGLHGSEGQHYLRISTATSEADLEEAVRRMAAAAGDEAGFRRFLGSGAKLTLS